MAGSPKKRARREAGFVSTGYMARQVAEWTKAKREKEKMEGGIIKLWIQGLEYVCPPVPSSDRIRGSHLPTEDQVWYRDTTYEQWDWNTDPKLGAIWHQNPKKGQFEWYEREIEKLHSGDWVMIHGTPTYFNNYCYFFHQWFTLKNGTYPIYKDTSLEYFRFYQLCEDDPFTLGDCGIKGRRVGLSSMSSAITLLIGLLENNTIQGIVSKTGLDAKEMYNMVKNGLEGLPEFLIPDLAKVAETELHIAKPRSRITAHNRSVASDKGKNNRVGWLATAENAYDGWELRKVTIDECLAPDTKILCKGYVFREIRDVKVGDYVIVEGGKKKRVAKVFNGVTDMFLIKQPYSKDYVVSENHRLYLEQRGKTASIHDDGIKTITPVEYLKLDNYRKRVTHGLRSSGIEFPKKDTYIDPYIFGAWIGDGKHQDSVFICNRADEPELYQHLWQYGEQNGFLVSETYTQSEKTVRLGYRIKNRVGRGGNKFLDELRKLGVYRNKHIPNCYLHNSRESRLRLLAGIIDTDGHCNIKKGSIVIAMSREALISQISFLGRSLGFSVSKIRHSKSNHNSNVYKISLSGNLAEIPMVVKRKQFTNYEKKSAFRRNRIEISSIGKGEYVGIQVEATNDDGRRLILEDFTLTLNSAKWDVVNVQICLSKISETLVQGSAVIGHVSVFSSVNKGDKGGDNFKEIWKASNHHGREEPTQSRLKRFFLEGYRGFFGYVGKYGESIVENPTPEQSEYLASVLHPITGKKACPNPYIGAKQFLQKRRDELANDPEMLSEWVRMYPFEWQEAFKDANNMCSFNIEDLTHQISRIEALLEGTGLQENGRRGHFKKRDDGKVVFEDNKAGMWYILEFIEDCNKSSYQGSIKCPDNTIFGAGGLDPFAHGTQTVDKGSDACCIIHKRYDYLDPENSNYPCAMFLGRPNSKPEFFNQVFWGLEYYGVKMLGEKAPSDWIEEAITRRMASPHTHPKLHGYLVTTKRANNSEVYGANPQDKDGREQHLTEMIEYAHNNMHKIKFLRVLKDMVNFDIENRTRYDATMAWGYALMALKEGVHVKKQEAKVVNFMQAKRSKQSY